MPECSGWLAQYFAPVVAAAVLAWVTVYLTYRFELRRFRWQKLLDQYADFVGIVSDELERAKEVRAYFQIHGTGKPTDENANRLAKLEAARHKNTRRLASLVFRIQLVERHADLREQIAGLGRSPSIYMVRAVWESSAFQSEFDGYDRAVQDYEKRRDDLVRAVHKKHGHG